MSLDSMRGMVSGCATTPVPSSVDGNRSEAERSYADLRYSLYGILEVIPDMGLHWRNRTGATPYRMTSRRPADCWHDRFGNHTFGDTMLDRLVCHSHRLTLTGGSSRRLWNSESPTDSPPPFKSLSGDRHQPKGLTANNPFGSHLRPPIMRHPATAKLALRSGQPVAGLGTSQFCPDSLRVCVEEYATLQQSPAG
jgi:hypothetical protein